MLTLKVTAVHGAAPTTPILATFSEQGGTIGRNPGTTLMLLDDARTISRQQAIIRYSNNQFIFEEQGSNPSLVNGVQVGPGKSAQLKHGDVLRIAFYTLSVEIAVTPDRLSQTAEFSRRAMAPPQPPAMAPAIAPPVTPAIAPAANPLLAPLAGVVPVPVDAGASLFGSAPLQTPAPGSSGASIDDPLGLFGGAALTPLAGGQDPFVAAFGAPAPVISAPPELSKPAAAPPALAFSEPPQQPDANFDPFASAVFAPAPSAPQMPLSSSIQPRPATLSGIPDDFDPFASGSYGAKPAASGGLQDISFGTPSHEDGSLDSLFGLGGADQSKNNPLDAMGGPASAALSFTGEAPSGSSVDPMALFGQPSAAKGAGAAQANHTPEIHALFTPPKMQAPATANPQQQRAMDHILASVVPVTPAQASVSSPPVQAAPVQAARSVTAQDQEMMAAFCEGLGVKLNLPDGLNEEFMYRLGALMRESVQGTMDLLNARAVSKREVKAQATTIMERNNNPLKFAPDVASALPFLLSGKLNPAFLPPISAMRDAHIDLKSHQFGVMAGMRAALEGVLARFTPEQLEKRITKKGLLDSMIPATRKAKLWDSYTDMYKEIAREASDDFQKLFGEAFRQAYEEQIKLLQQSEPKI
jgi:FHA domain-containing protein